MSFKNCADFQSIKDDLHHFKIKIKKTDFQDGHIGISLNVLVDGDVPFLYLINK